MNRMLLKTIIESVKIIMNNKQRQPYTELVAVNLYNDSIPVVLIRL